MIKAKTNPLEQKLQDNGHRRGEGGTRELFFPPTSKNNLPTQKVIKFQPDTKGDIDIQSLRKLHRLASSIFNSKSIQYIEPKVGVSNKGGVRQIVFSEQFLPEIYNNKSDDIIFRDLCIMPINNPSGNFKSFFSNESTLNQLIDDFNNEQLEVNSDDFNRRAIILSIIDFISLSEVTKNLFTEFVISYKKLFEQTKIVMDLNGSYNLGLYVVNDPAVPPKLILNNSAIKHNFLWTGGQIEDYIASIQAGMAFINLICKAVDLDIIFRDEINAKN